MSFEDVKTVIADENARLIDDPDHSEEENRFFLPDQSLINLYLRDCAGSKKKIDLAWS